MDMRMNVESTMDDAHIFCTREQVGSELKSLLSFVLDLPRHTG